MPLAALLRMLLLAALWGGSFLFLRVAVPVLGPATTALGRVLLAAAGLLAIVGLMRVPRLWHGHFRATLVLGALNSGVPFLLFAHAAQVLPAGYSAMLNATTPLMAVVIGTWGFGETLTWRKAAGVVTGLLGVALLAGVGPVALTGPVLLGIAACLGAAACYALGGLMLHRWVRGEHVPDSRLVALGSQIGAMGVLALPGLWHPEVVAQHLVSAGAEVWGAVAALGLLCTALAYSMFFRLIAEVGPFRAFTVTFLIPLFGVLWGHWWLGEAVSWAHAAGGGVIALALGLVLQPDGVSQPQPARAGAEER